jgi:hypothetical protein
MPVCSGTQFRAKWNAYKAWHETLDVAWRELLTSVGRTEQQAAHRAHIFRGPAPPTSQVANQTLYNNDSTFWRITPCSPLKVDFKGLHGVTSQKIEFFVTIGVRTSSLQSYGNFILHITQTSSREQSWLDHSTAWWSSVSNSSSTFTFRYQRSLQEFCQPLLTLKVFSCLFLKDWDLV